MISKRLITLLLFSALAVAPVRAQWHRTNGPSGAEITDLVTIGPVLFAGTATSGVYRSIDSGETWNSANSGLTAEPFFFRPDTDIYDLVATDSILLASLSEGLYRSTDSGARWNPTALGTRYVTAIFTNGPNVIVSASDSIFHSTDYGIHWGTAEPGLPGGSVITSFASQDSILFACSGAGVFSSSDNGNSWKSTGLLAVTDVLATDGSGLFAATTFDGIFASHDEGATWTPVDEGLPSNAVVRTFGRGYGQLFAGTGGEGVFVFSDSNRTWYPSGLATSNVTGFTAIDSFLFVGTDLNGVFGSRDKGQTWNAENMGMPNDHVLCLGAADTTMITETEGGSFVSHDSGITWNLDYYLPQFYSFTSITTSFLSDMFLGVQNGVARSTDGGLSWTTNEAMPGYKVRALANASFILFAGTDSGGIFVSQDLGSTWSSQGVLYDTPITALAAIGTKAFVGIQDRGVFLTKDTGATWIPVNAGLADSDITTLLSVGPDLFAATPRNGIFVTTNLGASWNAVNAGLEDSDVQTLAVNGPWLLAGTSGHGLWRRELSEMIDLSTVNAPESKFSGIECFPNPFSHSTRITFTTDAAGYADVSIVNLLGTEVAHLFSGTLGAGEHSFEWNAAKAAAMGGVYECVVRSPKRVETIPIVLDR